MSIFSTSARKSRKKDIIKLSLAIFFLMGLAWPLSKKLDKQYQLSQEVEELSREIKKREERQKELSDILSYLDSSEFAEKEARINLNLKMQGEEVVVTRDSEKTEKAENIAPATAPAASANNPQAWLRYFMR